jgi:uncharacterized membrane protein YqhA
MLRSIFAASRFFLAIGVFASLLASVAVLIGSGITTVQLIIEMLMHARFDAEALKKISIEFIEVIDTVLLGTVLFVTASGLYQLFIDDQVPFPPQLKVRSLDELKERLIGVIVVLLGVTFLASATDWDSDFDIVAFGASIALVIFSLAFLMFVMAWRQGRERRDESRHEGPPTTGS